MKRIFSCISALAIFLYSSANIHAPAHYLLVPYGMPLYFLTYLCNLITASSHKSPILHPVLPRYVRRRPGNSDSTQGTSMTFSDSHSPLQFPQAVSKKDCRSPFPCASSAHKYLPGTAPFSPEKKPPDSNMPHILQAVLRFPLSSYEADCL